MTDHTLTQEQTHNNCSANDAKSQRCICNARPLADVVESTDSVVLYVELPGVHPENLEVTVENGVLDVTGTAERSLPEGFQSVGDAGRVRRYFRQFKLAEALDSTQMQAEFKNGLLKLTVPKKPENRRQKISISTTA